jgi:flagellar protein FlbD
VDAPNQGRIAVILLTRLGGPVFALNPDLVERADCTPDTVITLVDGKKYVVAESLPELIALIRQFRATVVADAQQLVAQPGHGHAGHTHPTGPHLVNGPASGRTDARSESRPEPGTENLSESDAEPTNVVQLHRRER